MLRMFLASLLAGLLVAASAPAAELVTDEAVSKAVEKGRAWLIATCGDNGLWMDEIPNDFGHAELATMTLLYTGMSPAKEKKLAKSLDAIMARNLNRVYATSARCMALAYALKKAPGDKKVALKNAMIRDVAWLVEAQGKDGGWDYLNRTLSLGDRFDFSNTQMAILALREAAMAGAEIPSTVWERTLQLYAQYQQKDGSWNYGDLRGADGRGGNAPGYGTMTAAGLASVFICMDNLDLSGGCPCKSGASTKGKDDAQKRIALALGWIEKNFRVDANPKAPPSAVNWRLYWLYSVERVGLTAGYKYFAAHNWYHEGAASLLHEQKPDGSWGNIEETCLAMMFLYKGRTPILFNKLECGDTRWEWNAHFRDVANLCNYFEKIKELPFAWQVVNLKAPIEELHDAPILYITAETPPAFTPEEKQKLRAFTDSGGTILIEASCGNPRVRVWATGFFREVWPEWLLKPLTTDHPVNGDPSPLTKRPDISGLDDGERTFLFYAADDISCPWQVKMVASREYLFRWGLNLYTYATDHAALHPKLLGGAADPEAAGGNAYDTPVKAAKPALAMARVKYGAGAGWLTGRNYNVTERLTAVVQKRAGVALTVTDSGVAAADLKGVDVAYLVGTGMVTPAEADRAALKAFAAKGGWLWIENAAGSETWDKAFRKMATEMKWDLKDMPSDAPAMTGDFTGGAVGYDLTRNVRFRHALRAQRIGPTARADLAGIYQDGKLIGVYSSLDVLFCMSDYDAGGIRGYQKPDAEAVATNLVLLAGDHAP